MKTIWTMLLIGTLAGFSGCTSGNPDDGNPYANMKPTGPEYLTDSEPDGALPVGDARKATNDGEAIVVVGHIGGSTEPFVDGISAFTIVDPKVPYCQPDEGCPTPWDYCCTQNDVKDNIATVKVVNDQGKPVAEDARKLLGVKELSLVVVEGKAVRDEQGNLSVLATKIFVRK